MKRVWLVKDRAGREGRVMAETAREAYALAQGLWTEWERRDAELRRVRLELSAILRGARNRCRSPNNPLFYRYGGRGIEYRLPEPVGAAVDALLAALGPRPVGKSLDRRDNDGHYELSNLRWATASEQANNRGGKRRARRRSD